ncbi:hypothetical protein BGZ97_005993 [Linnemannia gamsii]|jgi:chromobox protein 1|uniref:Chromo domain-containing protein n=1 Tax=Linnemannia gamsii TaxID=64522 RepID=A0A9P6REK7_9FUNG|nr:hypothetical protein BGZ97_005993 [Linnemannia gamsii]
MTDTINQERAASSEPSIPLKEQKSDEANNTEEVIQNNNNNNTTTGASNIVTSDVSDKEMTEEKAEDRTEDKTEDKVERNVDSTDKEISGSKDDDEDDIDEDAEEAEYEVERVVGHKHTKGRLQYHLKWNGYDSDDNTWEDKDNVYCVDLIEAYWVRLEEAGGSRSDLKGKDGVPAKKESARSLKSNGATVKATKKDRDGDTMMGMAPAKRQKTTGAPKDIRKAAGRAEEGARNSSSSGGNWVPPKNWASWEDKVETIQTVERNNQKLLIRLAWKNGKESQHPIEEAHQRCPQKLIQFYESHIKFSQA